jgi:hypothetical protein
MPKKKSWNFSVVESIEIVNDITAKKKEKKKKDHRNYLSFIGHKP